MKKKYSRRKCYKHGKNIPKWSQKEDVYFTYIKHLIQSIKDGWSLTILPKIYFISGCKDLMVFMDFVDFVDFVRFVCFMRCKRSFFVYFIPLSGILYGNTISFTFKIFKWNKILNFHCLPDKISSFVYFMIFLFCEF